MKHLEEAFVELIRLASTDLPVDVEQALRKAREAERDPGIKDVLSVILENVRLARERSTPVCQDTGVLNFFVRHPHSVSRGEITAVIHKAVAAATAKNYLRPNAVDAVSGRNSGDNIGAGFPAIHFEERDGEGIEADLLLKGGGSENVSAQYKLPDQDLGAGRDLDGIRKAVLDAVCRAQGEGCAPGIVGIGVGGDRAGSFALAKKQLLRPLDDRNPDEGLDSLEKRLLAEANSLGIGPMGLGGLTTLLGVKIGSCHRHPACYFVSAAYLCWAARRKKLVYAKDEVKIG